MVYTLICHAEVKPGNEESMIKTLQEAASTYKNDQGTIDWLVHQDVKDPKKFAIVERFETKADIETHVRNPYFKTFQATVGPWLVKPIQILEYNKL